MEPGEFSMEGETINSVKLILDFRVEHESCENYYQINKKIKLKKKFKNQKN